MLQINLDIQIELLKYGNETDNAFKMTIYNHIIQLRNAVVVKLT